VIFNHEEREGHEVNTPPFANFVLFVVYLRRSASLP